MKAGRAIAAHLTEYSCAVKLDALLLLLLLALGLFMMLMCRVAHFV